MMTISVHTAQPEVFVLFLRSNSERNTQHALFAISV
jgi:hypothetical protein